MQQRTYSDTDRSSLSFSGRDRWLEKGQVSKLTEYQAWKRLQGKPFGFISINDKFCFYLVLFTWEDSACSLSLNFLVNTMG